MSAHSFLASSSSSIWSNSFLAFHLILFGTIIVGLIGIFIFHFTSKLVRHISDRRKGRAGDSGRRPAEERPL